MRRIITTMLALAVTAMIGVSTAIAAQAQIGQQAPNFTLTNQHGQPVSLSDYKGKIVVLEWVNHKCPFWRRLHTKDSERLKGVAEKYQKKGVVWLGINSTAGTGVARNRKIAQKYNIDYPILDDSSGKVGRMYGAKTTPHMFIINREGVLVYSGAIDNDPAGTKKNPVNYVSKALDELLAGEPVSIPKTRPYGCHVQYAN